MAADVGGNVHATDVLLQQLERREHRPFRTADTELRRPRRQRLRELRRHRFATRGDSVEPHPSRLQRQLGCVLRRECCDAARNHLNRVFARHRQQVLAVHGRVDVEAAQDRHDFLLDEFGLPLFHHQHCALPETEVADLVGDQRTGHVQHEQRQRAGAEFVGEAQFLQRANERVVEPALHDHAEIVALPGKVLVQSVFDDVAPRGGDALARLELLVAVCRRRMREPAIVERRGRILQVLRGNRRRHVVLADEAAADVTRADAQLQHHRRVRRFRQREAFLHHPYHVCEVRARVEQHQ
jgi:hypothetical protein